MKISLPIYKPDRIENGKVKINEYEQSFELITSLASEMRYEALFPKMAEHEDLITYTDRIINSKPSREKWLSELKVLYCWLDTDLSFIEFIDLFAQPNEEYIKKLSKRLKEIFDVVCNGSAEKN